MQTYQGRAERRTFAQRILDRTLPLLGDIAILCLWIAAAAVIASLGWTNPMVISQ